MRLLSFIMFLAILSSEIWCRLKPIQSGLLDTRLSLAKCVGQATGRFFGGDEIVLVSLSILESLNTAKSAIAMDALLFYELFNRSSLSIIIKKTSNPNTNEFYMKKVDNYIIQLRQPSEIKVNLGTLKAHPTWNSHAKFMIISAAIFPNPDAVAAGIIEELSVKNVVNGVVILVNPKNTTTFIVYTWFPFSEGRCSSGSSDIRIIDSCDFGQLEKGLNWFPNKIPANLHGCSLRVRVVVWPPYVLPPESKGLIRTDEYTFKHGLEIMIMNTMAEIANFSIAYSVSDKVQDWGTVYKNGTTTGALLYLSNEECDIAIGSFSATTDRRRHFDTVTYNIPESLTWCVPHAEDAHQWKKLLMVVPIDIWYCCALIYFLTSFCLWALCYYEPNESTSYKSLPSSMQNAFSIFVNMAVKVQPRSLKVRLLFIIWVLVTLHIAAIYQTSLISVLTKPKYEQKIKTVYDIIETNMAMWFLPNTKTYFRDKSDWLNLKIMEQWRDCNDIAKCLNETAFQKNSVTCTPRLYMKYAVNHYITKNGNPLLYCFKESIVTYPLEMILTKGFPLHSYFEILLGRITAAGLIAHWEKQIFDFQFRNIAYATVHQSEDIKLTITQLELIFIILVIGNLCGVILFALEIYIYRRRSVKFDNNLQVTDSEK